MMLATIGIIFAVLIFLTVFSKMADEQELEKKQIEQELENKKKADELALEIQRKNHEYELERKKKAILDPVYQDIELRLIESNRKTQQYKIAMIVIIVVALVGGAYLFFKDDRSTQSEFDYESSSSKQLNKQDVDSSHLENIESISENSNDVLPARYVPVEATESVKVVQQLESPKVERKPISIPSTDVVKIRNKNHVESSTQLSVYEANSFIGQNTTVCGTVSQISSTSKAIYINFGGRYPKQAFSAVIWSSSNEVPVPAENENVCISGLIESYKGIPQIVIQSVNNQISIH